MPADHSRRDRDDRRAARQGAPRRVAAEAHQRLVLPRRELLHRGALSRRGGAEPFGGPPPDFLSHSHGEGFLRFFEERCQRQGLFIFDEPESALSPSRQIEFLKLLRAWRSRASSR